MDVKADWVAERSPGMASAMSAMRRQNWTATETAIIGDAMLGLAWRLRPN